MIIKVLLVGAVVGLGLQVMRERGPGQHQLVRRVAMLALALAGIVAVLWPDLTTVVANVVGVGRGTDLVLYVLVMAFVYHALATAQRIHQLERALTKLTRELALAHPQAPATTATRALVDRDGTGT